MSQDLSSILPEKVQVVFRGRRCTGMASQTVPAFYVSTVELEDIELTDPDADLPEGLEGTVQTFHDACVALFAVGDGDPTNQEALDDLAKQVAQDFYDWRSQKFDTSYAGIVAPEPNGLFDEITWVYDGDRLFTRVVSQGWNGEPEELQHQDPAVADCTDANNGGVPVQKTPGCEVYGPPGDCFGGGAKATATLDDDGVDTIEVTSGGSGYTTAPTVQFSEGDGTGAAATATIDVTTGKVTSVAVTDAGSGYTAPPIVSFQGGGSSVELTRYRHVIEDGRLVAYFVSTDTLA